MKTCWLNRQDHPDSILFMAGWGMGPEPFQGLAFGPADVLMVYNYQELDNIDFSSILPASSRIHLLAWSMGVWAAARLFQENAAFSALHFTSSTALGGTCQPIDEQCGIPAQLFDLMLQNFSPELLTIFYRSMFDSNEEAERFLRCPPTRPAEELREELLIMLRNACADLSAVPDIYSRRIVTVRDRVFPARNQVRAWGRKNCTKLALPHFPFYQWTDWFSQLSCSTVQDISSGKLKIFELLTNQYEDRPEGTVIDTLIIHSMYNPEAKDRFSAQSCKACLDRYGVSAHYLIEPDGKVWRSVPEEKKAWHAGISRMPDPDDGREGVNDFSIGIELIGTEDTEFTEAQYDALVLLTKDIISRHAVRNIYGHCHIAPGRKTDPWGLDWGRYRREIRKNCRFTVSGSPASQLLWPDNTKEILPISPVRHVESHQ